MSAQLSDLYERKIAILVEDLRLWILNQPHLNSRIDDDFLRGFLRCCHYDLSATKIRLDKFYTLKTHIPKIMTQRNVNKQLLMCCDIGIAIDLPVVVNPKDVRLNFSKFPHSDLNTSTFNYSDVMKCFFMIAEIKMIESRYLDTQAATIYVIDFEGLSFTEIFHIDFKFLKKSFQLIQPSLPLHIEEVHFINVSRYLAWIFSGVCYLYFNADFRKKFHIHSTMDSFYKYIPQIFLPIEYGGQNGSIRTCIKVQIERLRKFEQYFEEDDMYGVNEALRRKK